MPRAQARQILKETTREQRQWMLDAWEFWAEDAQWPPPGDWRVWLFMGGRGAGKTRAGAEFVAHGAARGYFRRIAMIGATHRDARAVMVEGESGLLACAPKAQYQPANARVKLGRALVHVLSAEEPDAIRGFQFDAAWLDEFAKWRDPDGALAMLDMALRLGGDPRMCITTTPRNIAALKSLIGGPGVVLTRRTTAENAIHLAPAFYGAMQARFGGTRLGRQELDAELIEDNDRALWRRDWIEAGRIDTAPALSRIVVAVDPPASAGGDECGIVVAGRDEAHAYVLADRSEGGLSPAGWARRVLDAYEAFAADVIVAEANQGGDMVRAVLAQEMQSVPIRLVHASRGKRVRAQPAAALYERGLVHHAGRFPELEDQLCQYDGEDGASPDRMDALVWALADLFPPTRKSPPKVRKL